MNIDQPVAGRGRREGGPRRRVRCVLVRRIEDDAATQRAHLREAGVDGRHQPLSGRGRRRLRVAHAGDAAENEDQRQRRGDGGAGEDASLAARKAPPEAGALIRRRPGRRRRFGIDRVETREQRRHEPVARLGHGNTRDGFADAAVAVFVTFVHGSISTSAPADPVSPSATRTERSRA